MKRRITAVNIAKAAAVIMTLFGAYVLVRSGYLDFSDMSPAHMREHVRSFGVLAVLVYSAAYVVNTLSMIIPITPLALAAGFIFGAGLGAAYLMAASLIGAALSFTIARFLGRSLLEKYLKGRAGDIDKKVEKNGFKTVFFLRIVPVIPFGIFNYLCGITKINFKDYFMATFLGLIPSVFIVSFFGDALGDMTGKEDIFSPNFLIATALLALRISILPVYHIIESRRKRRALTAEQNESR